MPIPRLPLAVAAALTALTLVACGSTPSGSAAADGKSAPDSPVSSTDRSVTSSVASPRVGGTVRDASGRPVEGALIAITGTGTTSYGMPDVAVLTGADGAWTFTVPGAGTYDVSASHDGASATGALTVTADGGRVDLSLR